MAGLALEVRDLVVKARSGRLLLSVPRLDVPKGTSLAIEGPSGAGKSTLLFALAGLTTRTNGAVCWGETDLSAARAGQKNTFRARHIGMIFQDFLLFDELGPLANASITADFAPSAARDGIEAQADGALTAFGVPKDARSVARNSAGERQRIAAARALAGAPDVILADEPTAALDRDTADALAEDLVTRCKDDGLTLIVVTHDPAISARMDRVIRVVDGGLADA